ncbi:MAG: glycine betaine ABC transporter substrate-binding protein [Thermodesulfovibrionales bacterium]
MSPLRLLAAAAIVVLALAACESGGEKVATVTVGSKHFTEQEVLGEMLAMLIENTTGLRAERRLNLGGTMVCFNALRSGDIDVYVEYTGTGLVNILGEEAVRDPDRAYEAVKEAFAERYGIAWLRPLGFNNTYALTMRRGQARALGVRAISDLVKHRDRLQPGFDAEFMERSDGYPGLTELYGFSFQKRPMQMDPGLMYKALAEGAVDVIDGFATDGRIPAYGLVTLEDDKGFFPPYYAAPILRRETLERYPALGRALSALSGRLDDETMRRLNFEVDEKERRPRDVAREFLRSEGLI